MTDKGDKIINTNTDEGATKIIEMYDKWSAGQPFFTPTPEIYERFSRRNLARELAGILNSLTQKSDS